MKYNVGDRVRIAKNINEHKFEIGEIVTIEDVGEIDYKASNDSDYWWVQDNELKSLAK